VSGSGICWAICKSAPHPRQPHQVTNIPPLSFFTGRMPFLPPNQQHQSTEGKSTEKIDYHNLSFSFSFSKTRLSLPQFALCISSTLRATAVNNKVCGILFHSVCEQSAHCAQIGVLQCGMWADAAVSAIVAMFRAAIG